MKIAISLLLILNLFPENAIPGETDSATSNATSKSVNGIQISRSDSSNTGASQFAPRTHQTLLYDSGLTMRSGAENVLFIHHNLSHTVDRILGKRWFSEKGFFRKSGGVLGRFAKYLLLDGPMDLMSVVIAHEYFGHASRYREFDIGDIHDHFEAPFPYGPSGGSATISNLTRRMTNHELLVSWQAGLEVHELALNDFH